MKRTLINASNLDLPQCIKPLVENAAVYDSSCSPEAKVIFIDKDGGYYLKCAAKGSLQKEALMTEYFHKKGIGALVVDYFSEEKDWLLTERVLGEDCTCSDYIKEPIKLCDTLAFLLRELHETEHSECPVDHTAEYFKRIDKNYQNGMFDGSFAGEISSEDAYKIVSDNKRFFKNDTLLHGDYCLPNIILNDWNFSGFIDLGNGGVGDRHVDLFWGAWTLDFNLGTDKYRERFFDAYGRDKIEAEMIRVVAAAEVFG